MQREPRKRGRRQACLHLSVVRLDSSFYRRRTRGGRGGGSLKKELGVVRRLERAVHRESNRVILVEAIDQRALGRKLGLEQCPVIHPGCAHHPELGDEIVFDLTIARVVIVAPIIVDRIHQRARCIDHGLAVGCAVDHPATVLHGSPSSAAPRAGRCRTVPRAERRWKERSGGRPKSCCSRIRRCWCGLPRRPPGRMA